MSQQNTAQVHDRDVEDGQDGVDGRRARSERSRSKIVDAVLKLVRSGKINPDAQSIANVAQVSLRTVYRHFEDTESLFKEIARESEATSMPIFMLPYEANDWRGRLREHTERRLQVYEETMYLRMCTNARRFRSEFLMQDYERYLRLERTSIESLLLSQTQIETALIDALDIVLSFDAYLRLRQERGYSAAKAREVITQMLENTLRTVADEQGG